MILRKCLIVHLIIFATCLCLIVRNHNAFCQESDKSVDNSNHLFWRSLRNCGINCIYLMLKIHELEPNYDQLANELMACSPQSDNSLMELARAARKRGLPCGIGKTSPSGLQDVVKPVIAHWENEGKPSSGHFVVVIRTTPDTVLYIDGSTSAIGEMSWRDFSQSWTGYILFSYPSMLQRPPMWLILGFSFAGGIVMGALFSITKRIFHSCRSFQSRCAQSLFNAVKTIKVRIERLKFTLCLCKGKHIHNPGLLPHLGLKNSINIVKGQRSTGRFGELLGTARLLTILATDNVGNVRSSKIIVDTEVSQSRISKWAIRTGVFFWFFSLGLPVGLANDWMKPKLDDIGKVYEKRTSTINSFLVEYELRAENLVDMKMLKQLFGTAYLLNEDVILAFQERKVYCHTITHYEKRPGVINIPESKVIFDGNTIQEERLRGQVRSVPQVLIYPPNPDEGGYFPGFYTNAICLPYYDPGSQSEKPQPFCVPELVTVPGVKVYSQVEIQDGVACVVLEVPGKQKIWFDPTLEFTVRKQELYDKGVLYQTISCRDFLKIPQIGWFPKHVDWFKIGPPTAASSELRGRKLLRMGLKVKRLEVNHPEHNALFSLKIKAGSVVHNKTVKPLDSTGNPIQAGPNDPVVTYRQPARQRDLDIVVRRAQIETGHAFDNGGYRISNTRLFLIGLAVLLFIILGFFLARSLWQRRHVH